MEVRFSADMNSYKSMGSDELRNAFLVEKLFKEDEIYLLYSDVDRAIIGSAVPVSKDLRLESSKKEMAAEYFAERREIGIINIGGTGSVTADGNSYQLENKDALYIGKGTKEISFSSSSIDKNNPPRFYIVSYPSHKEYPAAQMKFAEAEPAKLGSNEDANKRTIYKFIHANGIKSSQLVMGLTVLEPGSVWNTMPAHTHQRRSEVYLYFDMDENSVMFHMMGLPDETRHLVIRNRQAVISPSWSIHCGAATKNYTFIWAMGGENQAFDDMDPVAMKTLK